MCSLVFVLLELIILTFCVCEENADCTQAHQLLLQRETPHIVLLEPKNITHVEKFSEDTRTLGLNAYVICSGGIEATIAAAKMFPNTIVVNLYVNDFYKFNYNYIKQNNLLYAGDVDDIIEVVQYATSVQGSEENNYRTCNVNTQELHYVKLVSDAVEGNVELHDYIKEFPRGVLKTTKDSDKDVMTLLVCSDYLNDYTNHLDELTIRSVYIRDCKREIEKRKNEILAILSASPFEIDYEPMIPRVFYKTPYDHARSPFTNVISLVPSWEPLKYAFLSLLNKMKWKRVAILTDTSAFSEEFQNALAALFYENGIVFTVKQCKEVNLPASSPSRFDCRVALKFLKDNDARIVIANVAGINSQSFAKQVADAERRSHVKMTWLMMHQPYVEQMSEHMGSIISIYLTPKTEHNGNETEVNQIRNGLKKIINAYMYVKRYTDSELLSIKDTQRAFTDALITIRDQTNNAGVTAHVLRVSGSYTARIGSIDIKDGEVFANYTSLLDPAPDMTPCIVRSNNYSSPCNVMELNLIMMITIVFLGTFLAVFVYFSEINTAVRRMSRYRNIA